MGMGAVCECPVELEGFQGDGRGRGSGGYRRGCERVGDVWLFGDIVRNGVWALRGRLLGISVIP